MSDVAHNFGSGGWSFTPSVVEVFDQHVVANVPHYDVVQEVVAHLSDWLAPAGATVVDFGASTGTTTEMIGLRHPDRSLHFHLYDTEAAMLDAARDKHSLRKSLSSHSWNYHREDVTVAPTRHENADLTLSLFTLQFLPPHKRRDALLALRNSARNGTGAIVIAEKVEQPSAFWQEVANEATWDYKSSAGVDADTIRAKARALRGVLVPLPEDAIVPLLASSGWSNAVCVWRWHQWGVWAATADPNFALEEANYGEEG